MTLLALLRHAETAWSAEGRLQGRTDIPLNNVGRAAVCGRRLPEQAANLRVACSPLLRCMQTAQCLGLQHVAPEPRITEMSWGEWEGQLLRSLRDRLGDTMVANEARGWDFEPTRGESPRQVWDRVEPWLECLAHAGADTLAISHRGVIRVIFAKACGWDMLGKPPARLDWSALHLFQLGTSGHPRVLRLNVPLLPVSGAGAAQRVG